MKKTNFNPKDKAFILVSDIERYLPDFPYTHSLAKKLALMSVYEITNALIGCHTAEEYGNYWDKVKKEIEKL